MRLFDSTLCRFLASQCVQESCLGNSPHVVRDVQLPPASYSTSLQSDLTLSSTLACCGSTYKPESASFVVINTFKNFDRLQGTVKVTGERGTVK